MSDRPLPDNTAELARCRDEIEYIDNEIVTLLARRLALAKRTGVLKRADGQPVADPAREADVLRRIALRARDAGLPVDDVRDVFWRVVGMSRRAQEQAESS
jgi:chorismate mutase